MDISSIILKNVKKLEKQNFYLLFQNWKMLNLAKAMVSWSWAEKNEWALKYARNEKADLCEVLGYFLWLTLNYHIFSKNYYFSILQEK